MYIDQHTDPELYDVLAKAARYPGIPHKVYAAASDALGFTRRFSKGECARMVVLDEVRYSLIPMLKNCIDNLEEKHPNVLSSIGIIEARFATMDDPEAWA